MVGCGTLHEANENAVYLTIGSTIVMRSTVELHYAAIALLRKLRAIIINSGSIFSNFKNAEMRKCAQVVPVH